MLMGAATVTARAVRVAVFVDAATEWPNWAGSARAGKAAACGGRYNRLRRMLNRVCASAPSLGHCTRGHGHQDERDCGSPAFSDRLLAIPRPSARYGVLITGRRIVAMVNEELRPSKIMTRDAFINAIVTNTAIGGSTNAPPHMVAIARHMGIELTVQDFQDYGYQHPLLVNMQPAGEFLGESFHRAGGVPAVMGEMMKAGYPQGCETVLQADGREPKGKQSKTPRIKTMPPMRNQASLSSKATVDSAAEDSVISKDARSVLHPGKKRRSPRVVFEGPEHHHAEINDPELQIEPDYALSRRRG